MDVPIKPTLQALVLADQIYQDATTGKKVIAGTFNALWTKELPTRFGRETWAYVSLTNLLGEAEVQLRYVDLTNNSVLMETNKISVSSDDRLRTVEMVLPIPRFPMPHAGVFAFEVYAGGDLIGSHRIMVGQVERKK